MTANQPANLSPSPVSQNKSENRPAAKFSYFTPWLFVLTFIWLVIYWNTFPRPLELAAKNWPLILVGVAGATIGNITAIGGGLVFIPVLMFAYQLDPVSSLKLAFVSQSAGMSSGASGWLRRGEVPLSILKWTVPTLVLGAMVSTFIFHPKPMLVKGVFGPIALVTGVLTLVTINRKGGLIELPARAHLPLLVVSFFGGLITGWVAIGEGEIIAAFCMLVYGLNATRAIGLGVVLLAINSILLATMHSLFIGGIPWEAAVFTFLGAMWGGRLGPYLAQWVSLLTVKKIFAAIAILDGLMVILQFCYVTFFK